MSIRHDRVPVLKRSRFLINWGSSEPLPYRNCRILNAPEAVAYASNKINTFTRWTERGVPCPEWTPYHGIAQSWIEEGHTVFCRTRLQAHSGIGIVIASSPDELVQAPLYTKYIKKKKEFRVHIINNTVVDVQEKRRAFGNDSGFLIRNHANGFVFCRDNIIEPTTLRTVAMQAVSALDLDFGAVDIIYNAHYDQCYALEVNTAPGLEGTTLDIYTNKFVELAYE